MSDASILLDQISKITTRTADAVGLNLFIIERVLFVLFPLVFLITVKSFYDYLYLGYTTIKV